MAAPHAAPDAAGAPQPSRPGEIITFYSYKGGTGRTMALANVAWILATRGKRVLVVDWDLEAPGLHRYFRPLLPDKELLTSDGVLDMVWQFSLAALDPSDDDQLDWYVPFADVLEYAVSLRWDFADEGTIDFIGAGRQDAAYATRLRAFDWTNFYDRLGGGNFLQAVRRSMRAEYDYVLIDSRTGLSDTAGICTVELPDTVVLAFTMNIQSMAGAAAVGESVLAQTKAVRILPVPMRVEDGEHARLESARSRAREHLGRLLADDVEDVARYWGEIEIPYVALYAYDELLAPVEDRHGQINTVLHAVERLTSYLTRGKVGQVRSDRPSEQERRELSEAFAQNRRAVSGAPSVRCVTAEGTVERISFQVVEQVDADDVELPVRVVVDRGGRRMVQKWIPAEARGSRLLRALLDAEIRAGVRFAECFPASRYPPELPRLVAYDVDGSEPFVLLQEYRGTSATKLVVNDHNELLSFYNGLLGALRRLQAADVVHGAVAPENVRWDGRVVQLVGFEHAARTGAAPRREGDDLTDALRVFVAVATRSGPLRKEYRRLLAGVRGDRGELAGPDDGARPTLVELQRRTHLPVEAVAATDPELELADGRTAFHEAVQRKRGRSGDTSSRRSAETSGGLSASEARTLTWLLVAVLVLVVLLVAVYGVTA